MLDYFAISMVKSNRVKMTSDESKSVFKSAKITAQLTQITQISAKFFPAKFENKYRIRKIVHIIALSNVQQNIPCNRGLITRGFHKYVINLFKMASR